jgi:serine/threonine-protein kinase HipA
VSKQNDFALLREIGGECAGAVSLVLEEGTQAQETAPSIHWLSPAELDALITQLPQRPMMAGQDGLRLSLAGAQDKLPVCLKEISDSQYLVGLPIGNQPSTNIVKPPIPNLKDTVINEFFCMRLAHNLGLLVAPTLLIPTTRQTVLAVARYDRSVDADNRTIRLHQEDFCQALGIAAENKYQNEGGPSLKDCFELIRSATSNSATSILSFLDYVIFNTLIGNHDAHGKNFSLVYSNGKAQIAPLYDCLSTAIYSTLTAKMAMKIGGEYEFKDVHAKNWGKFAADAGLSSALTKQRVAFFLKHLPVTARKMQAASNGESTDSPILEQICQLIEQRCALTSLRLSEKH